MPGSKTNELSRAKVRAAVRALPKDGGYVWDGVNEDDRPLSSEEFRPKLADAHERCLARLAAKPLAGVRPVPIECKRKLTTRVDTAQWGSRTFNP